MQERVPELIKNVKDGFINRRIEKRGHKFIYYVPIYYNR